MSVRSIWILDIYVRFKFTWYPLWKGSNAHYRECCEYNVDISSFDIGKMLSGLERKDFGDLIKMEIVTHWNSARLKFVITLHWQPCICTMVYLPRLSMCWDVLSSYALISCLTLHAKTLMDLVLLWKSFKYQHKWVHHGSRIRYAKLERSRIMELMMSQSCQICAKLWPMWSFWSNVWNDIGPHQTEEGGKVVHFGQSITGSPAIEKRVTLYLGTKIFTLGFPLLRLILCTYGV